MEDVVHLGTLMTSVFRRRATLVLASVLLVGCFPSDDSLERRDLVSDPAARIRMPGAEELAHRAHERESTIEGPSWAYDTYVFGTQATADDTVAFYARELGKLGWTRDDVSISAGTTDLKALGWCRPRMAYRLAILRPNAFDPSVYRGKAYGTVYDAGLVAVRPGAKCPAFP